MESVRTVFLTALFSLCFPAPINLPTMTVVITLTGQDRELRCLAEVSEGSEVLVLEWTRHSSGHYVLLYKEDRVLHGHQHAAYRNRVELRDPDLRSGDLTILMKNISTEDSGVYQCKAQIETSEGRREEHAQFFHLKPVKPTVAYSGEDCALPCASSLGGAEVLDLQWTREGSDGHVLWYTGGRLQDEHQNPAFKNRVKLQKPELRSGNMNIFLKNISNADSGVYQCHYEIQTPDGPQTHSQFIQLTVKPGTRRRGGAAQNVHVFWGIGVGVFLLILLVVGIIVFISVRCSKKTDKQTDPTLVTSKHPEDRGEESDNETQSSSAQTNRRSLTRFSRVRYSSLSCNGSAENVLLEPAHSSQ